MESKELARWMERRGVGQALRAWVGNEVLGRRNYSDLQGLVTDGTATIQVKLSDRGKLVITATETFEGEVTNLEQENKDLKKTVKNQEKQIVDLTAQAEAATQKETEEVDVEPSNFLGVLEEGAIEVAETEQATEEEATETQAPPKRSRKKRS